MTRLSMTAWLARICVALSILLAVPAWAGDQSSRSITDLTWEQGAPGLQFALLWGDRTEDDYAMIVRIEAGHSAPRHSHTADYHGVTIQGNWVHNYGTRGERVLGPGSYAFQAGGEDHDDRCAGPEDCLILIHQHGPRDFLLLRDQGALN